MKQWVLFFACLAILIATALESDLRENKLKRSGKESSNISRVYLETTIDDNHNDSFEKPNVSLCCRVGTVFTRAHGCMETTRNETEMVQLPMVYDVNLVLENITTSDEYFNFVIWNPCVGKYRYFLDPHSHVYDKWYLMSNGSILQPATINLKMNVIDYHQYCLARINSTKHREYLVFLCMEKNNKTAVNFSYALFVSVLFLIATYIVYWLLPELKNLHGLTLRGYIGCLAMAYSILGTLQLRLQIPPGICQTLDDDRWRSQ
ncbi:probable G-protein coupled receptor Mth-like 10 [Anoplolepis gracilipes]|uniref:probable G-protein coupled receptor Mth-like 10 n=1 Tax=Anoplolepis gracilipes TaxID=354296 RepID=UPI003BA373DB